MSRDDAVLLRPWQPADNEALVNIARTMSLPARVRLGIDRAPDFAAFCRNAGDDFDVVVAEVDGRVAGFMETRRFKFRLRGNPVRVAYLALVGVEPGNRGLGLFRRLTAEVERRTREADADLALGLVNARNPRMSGYLAANRADIVIGRRIVVASVLLGQRHRVAPDLAVGPAAPSDLGEIAQLVGRSYERHIPTPVVDEAALSALGAENITVCRDRGRIVATLGTWDQRALRRIMVVGYGWAERGVRQLLNLAGGLTHIARLPAPGEELRVLYAAYAAAEPGSEGAFAGLLRSVCNRVAGRGYHALLLGLPEDDPLAATTRGLWQFRNVDLPVVIPRDATLRALLGAGPPSVRFEYAFA